MDGRQPFEVEIERSDQAATLLVRGEIDIDSVSRLELARDSALEHGPEELVIDLRSVSFVDSTGLRLLLETHTLALGGNWNLTLLKPDEHVMRVFEVTGAERHLPFADGTGASST